MPGLRRRPRESSAGVSLLFDQNLSRRLVSLLAAEYPDSEHVESAGLLGAADHPIWLYAKAKGLMVVSKDSDFRHLALLHGSPPKVLWLRIGNGPTATAERLLRSRLSDVRAFAADPALSLLILP